MEQQVDKNKYNFLKYCTSDRWASYWYQINEIIKCNPENILEIGAGDKVLLNYIKSNTKINYKCLDIAKDLSPDIYGSVDNVPIEDSSFDVVCAFEVLEHLPFDKFIVCLNELKRVSKKKVIISLPHWGRHFSLKMRLPFFKELKIQYKINILPIRHEFNGEHYWEIGKKDYPLTRVKDVIRSTGLKLINNYVAFESPYHHFFVLEKNKNFKVEK